MWKWKCMIIVLAVLVLIQSILLQKNTRTVYRLTRVVETQMDTFSLYTIQQNAWNDNFHEFDGAILKSVGYLLADEIEKSDRTRRQVNGKTKVNP